MGMRLDRSHQKYGTQHDELNSIYGFYKNFHALLQEKEASMGETPQQKEGLSNLQSATKQFRDRLYKDRYQTANNIGLLQSYQDECAELQQKLESDPRFSTLVVGVVKSFPFQHRRKNVEPQEK